MRITKAQLERTDFLILILGAVFNTLRNKEIFDRESIYDYKLVHYESLHPIFNKILAAWGIIKRGFLLGEYFDNLSGLEKVADSFDIYADLKYLINQIGFKEVIEVPEFVKADYGYEYVEDLITFKFYDKI